MFAQKFAQRVLKLINYKKYSLSNLKAFDEPFIDIGPVFTLSNVTTFPFIEFYNKPINSIDKILAIRSTVRPSNYYLILQIGASCIKSSNVLVVSRSELNGDYQ